jgi:hypothetical protein
MSTNKLMKSNQLKRRCYGVLLYMAPEVLHIKASDNNK